MSENEDDRKVHTKYYLPEVEIKDCNVKTDGKNFFDQPIDSYTRTKNYNRSRRWLHDWFFLNYFNKNHKMIAIDLSKQQVLDADPK